MTRKMKSLAFLMVVLLSACASGSDFEGDQTSVINEIREIRKADRDAQKNPATTVQFSRATLDASPQPFLEVGIKSRDATAYLQPAAYRTGYGVGRVAVWKTGFGQSIALRNGILIGTKGLGSDLASADTSVAIKAIGTKSARAGLRTMYVRNDDNGTDTYKFQCSVSIVGSETLEIFQKRFSTQHLREDCGHSIGKISNDYWVDGQGTIRKSRQWAGPELGYLAIRFLE
jgi:hypothetical protein